MRPYGIAAQCSQCHVRAKIQIQVPYCLPLVPKQAAQKQSQTCFTTVEASSASCKQSAVLPCAWSIRFLCSFYPPTLLSSLLASAHTASAPLCGDTHASTRWGQRRAEDCRCGPRVNDVSCLHLIGFTFAFKASSGPVSLPPPRPSPSQAVRSVVWKNRNVSKLAQALGSRLHESHFALDRVTPADPALSSLPACHEDVPIQRGRRFTEDHWLQGEPA